jgi:amino acid permease
VYNEQAQKTVRSLTRIIAISVAFALACYLALGACGYLTFGRNIASNLIAAYPSRLAGVMVAQVAIVMLVICSFPLQLQLYSISVNMGDEGPT